MITMKDIAREVGVTQPTVSAILNDKKTTIRISDKVRQKVLKTAHDLGYCRNAVASEMRHGKSKVIGVVGHFSGDFCMKILCGIAREGDRHGYSLKLKIVDKKGDVDSLLDGVGNCVEYRVAGIVARGFRKKTLLGIRKCVTAYDIPIVHIGSSYGEDWFSSVFSDDRATVRELVEGFLSDGRKEIIHLTDDSRLGFYDERSDEFLIMAKEQLPQNPNLRTVELSGTAVSSHRT